MTCPECGSEKVFLCSGGFWICNDCEWFCKKTTETDDNNSVSRECFSV